MGTKPALLSTSQPARACPQRASGPASWPLQSTRGPGPACTVFALATLLAPIHPAWAQSSGPDLISGDVSGSVRNWGTSGDLTAYSIGSVVCNIGDEQVICIGSTNQHPVLAQHLYRLKDGRLEQIGISWVKHEFLMLAENDCQLGCIPPEPYDGTRLGVGCSHPASADLNGKQTRLGPRGHVNAFTGQFPYPSTHVPYPPPANYETHVNRRLQVHAADLEPALNQQAQYFAEMQYIAADDSAAGNGNNNVSYRPVFVSASGGGVYDLVLGGDTVRQTPAIHAWKSVDASVQETTLQVPGEGSFILGARASHLGDGWWHYEYALYNMNSDRSGQSFFVPLPEDASVFNAGFHDVDHHSGDSDPDAPGSIRGTDWPVVRTSAALIWQTDAWSSADRQANALRWGTLYNFWFDVNRAPVEGSVVLNLYKPGTPTTVNANTVVPQLPSGACCDLDLGTCTVMTQQACNALDAQYQGDGTTCVPNNCPQPPPRLILQADQQCYAVGDAATVEVWMHSIPDAILGGQFFLQYDAAKLELLGVDPSASPAQPFDPDNPFDTEIYECSPVSGSGLPQCQSTAGLIDYALGTRTQIPAFPGMNGTTRMAVLVFTVLQPQCNDLAVITWRLHDPPTRLSDSHGLPISPTMIALSAQDVLPPTLHDCPPTPIAVDYGSVPPPATVTATDNCSPAVEVAFDENRLDGPCAEVYTLTRTWTATDACDNVTSCQQVIDVQGPCRGACCRWDGTCSILTHAGCQSQEDTYQGDGTACEPDPCPPPRPELTLEPNAECFGVGARVVVEVWMHDIMDMVVGGQFFLQYDAGAIELLSVDPSGIAAEEFDPGNPYDTEVYECSMVSGSGLPQCTPTPGVLDYAVAARSQSPPFAGGNGTARLAVLEFAALQPVCDITGLLVWRQHEPPTRLSGPQGMPIVPSLLNLNVHDFTPPALFGCPPTPIAVNCDEVPAPATVTATDNCGEIPEITYVEISSDGPGVDMYTLTRTWTATDVCSNSSSCQQVIYVQGPCLGACCLSDNTCLPDVTETACETQDGMWQGLESQCGPYSCTPLVPAVSHWGSAAMVMLILCAGATLFRRAKPSVLSGRAVCAVSAKEVPANER